MLRDTILDGTWTSMMDYHIFMYGTKYFVQRERERETILDGTWTSMIHVFGCSVVACFFGLI